MTNRRQTRHERRTELDEQIAFRKRRIADDTAALHNLLRQSGALDAAEWLAANILEDGSLEGLGLDRASVGPASPRSREERSPADPASPTGGDTDGGYALRLIDSAGFSRFTAEMVDYKRNTLLEMAKILESSHPSPVKATDINRAIEELNLCPKPTFSKLKAEFRTSRLVSYNGSNKTWSIPPS